MRDRRARIIHRRLERSPQQLAPKVGVRLQVFVFPEDDEYGFAGVD
jgi:hypothetical protein